MAKVLVTESALEDIADAIRGKNGLQTTYKPGEMAAAIAAIPTPTGTKQITANGTGIDVAQYASADVAVPNTYAAADEGKVVSDGSLVAQTSKNIGANGTVDTTLNNQVVVAVPNSYSASDEGKVVSNGALVAQGSDTVTSNDTYDTTLINSLTVNVSGGGGSGYATGTITPSERTTSITFDTGLSTIHGIVVVPTDSTPLKNNGRTVYGIIALYPGTTMIKSICMLSGNTGASLNTYNVSDSATRFTVNGTSVTINTQPVGSGYYWETVTYTWYAW